MGIPKFFRWLSERYPLINQTSRDLPEVDNFFLDMNGVIHVSASSNSIGDFIPNLYPAKELDEIWVKVFQYLDSLVALVKPRQLLYISLDGVPPRAKMNNQRERRYKAVYEIQRFIKQEQENGRSLPSNWFNSSKISPATDFMLELNEQLRIFIKYKIQTDDLWKRFRVIFTGTDVIGEGEHKIQQYFRSTQFPPNTRHCIYGLDADLILLGLITHQPFTFLLREEVSIGNIRGYPDRRRDDEPPRFQCLYLNLLRDYLYEELKVLEGLDVERFIDDFVLLMVFVGNDFLPRVPTFEIDSGAVEDFFNLYKQKWSQTGYILEGGKIHWNVLCQYLQDMPQLEIQSLQKKISGKKRTERSALPPIEPTVSHTPLKTIVKNTENPEEDDTIGFEVLEVEEEKSPAGKLEMHITRGIHEVKKFYYREHLKIDYNRDYDKIKELVYHYCEGLQWVMIYYFENETDWQWYYPHDYAPMVSDFAEIMSELDLSGISIGYREPYLPLEQLLCVLPPFCANLLPGEYAGIMRDPGLAHMFPADPNIEYDVMCAKVGWASLKIIVPFVDFEAITTRARRIEDTPEIAMKNRCISDVMYWFDPRAPCQSLDTAYFGTIDCFIREEEMHYDLTVNYARPCESARTLPGFPSLMYRDFLSELKPIGVNLFNSISNSTTLCIKLQRMEMSIQEAYNSYYNQVVFVDYPMQNMGLVFAVSDSRRAIPKIRTEILNEQNMNEEAYLSSMRSRVGDYFIMKEAINVEPEMGLLVHYYPLKSLRRSLQGNVYPVFDKEKEVLVPIELIMKDREPGHPLECVQVPSLEEEFPIGSKVVLLSREDYGTVAEVTNYTKDKHSAKGGLRVRIEKRPKDIVEEIESCASIHYEDYFTLSQLSGILKKPLGLVSRFMGSLKIKVKNKGRIKLYQVGLDLKSDRDYLSILKYARWGGYWNQRLQEWQYSFRTVHIMRDYIKKFPLFWRSLESLWSGKGVRTFLFEDVFQYSETGVRDLEDIALWVHNLPSTKTLWSSVYSEYLSEDITQRMLEVAQKPQREENGREININPGLVFIESHPWTPPYSEEIHYPLIGQRVVNIKSSQGPFGGEGTVIARRGTDYAEVLFDDYIFNAINHHVMTVRVDSLICLNKQSRHEPRRKFDKQAKVSAWEYDDSNFRPKLGKRKSEQTFKKPIAKPSLNSGATEFVPGGQSIDINDLFVKPSKPTQPSSAPHRNSNPNRNPNPNQVPNPNQDPRPNSKANKPRPQDLPLPEFK